VTGWVESAFIAAVISSLVTVAGWYISVRHERRREAERREERIWDYQTALLADIRSTASRFASIDFDRHLQQVVVLIESAPEEHPYTPFVPREPGSLMWPLIAQEVHILPTDVIDSVVLFFSQLETIRHFVDDLRSEQFAQLERARKIAMYRDYVRMCQFALRLAMEAQETLHVALGLEPPSNSGLGPSSLRAASASAEEGVDEAEKSA
jgi:hypothetical protein